ncbi:MAG: tetratricopeptide repeat protein [Marinagarivorans sp.]|nr:tetratricopeptide repeat protein [Marinagarivorans sp.]
MNSHRFFGHTLSTLCYGAVCAVAVLSTGCANQAVVPAPAPTVAAPPIEIVTQAFETDTLYSLLVAELAGSRERLDIMLSNYIQQAIETQDAGVTQRAAQLASYMRQPTETLQMASQWAALDPKNPQAHYMAMAALTDSSRFFEAFEQGKFLIENQHMPHGLDVLAAKASQTTVSQEDATSLNNLYKTLASRFANDAQLLLGISFLSYRESDYTTSLSKARQVQTLAPKQEQAYYQELRVLEQQKSPLVQQRLGEVVALFPENQQLRLQYARDLTQTNLADAAIQFQTLHQQIPDDANIALALALTQYQEGNIEQAKAVFSPLTAKPAQADTANYYLAKIATQQNDPLKAIDYYLAVKPSKEFLPALANAVGLLHQNNQAAKALQLLTGYQLSAPAEYQEGIALLTGNHYKNLQQNTEALNTYNAAITRFPHALPLLYNRAMLLAEQNNLKDAERDFKTIIAIDPDHADALNSLGYLLVDTHQRLPEAMGYIERAFTLDPENPATIDSLGWAHYRSGDNDKAIRYLRQALIKMPNDEIAAHLGEVLWVNKQEQEAMSVWKQGLELNPNSRYIFERLQRFKIVPAQSTQP